EMVGPGALFNPARLDTDKDDYAPDEDVVVNGRGWKPGEEVDLYVVDDLGWIYQSTVTADADGKLSADPYFVVEMRHLGVTFDLVATGADSGLEASVRFTDAINVNVSASDASAAESGSPASDKGTFTITRSGSTALTVFYTLTGTAGNGSDYSTLSGSVSIPSGGTGADVVVQPIDDALVECSETVVLTITPDASYTVQTGTATVTMAD